MAMNNNDEGTGNDIITQFKAPVTTGMARLQSIAMKRELRGNRTPRPADLPL
jgi:hypothetical protein